MTEIGKHLDEVARNVGAFTEALGRGRDLLDLLAEQGQEGLAFAAEQGGEKLAHLDEAREPGLPEANDFAHGLLVVGVLVQPARGHPASAAARHMLLAPCAPSNNCVVVHQVIFSGVLGVLTSLYFLTMATRATLAS